MKILLVGSGGREHALALGLKADKSCTELHAAPVNPGIATLATIHPLAITDNPAICELAQKLPVALVLNNGRAHKKIQLPPGFEILGTGKGKCGGNPSFAHDTYCKVLRALELSWSF